MTKKELLEEIESLSVPDDADVYVSVRVEGRIEVITDGFVTVVSYDKAPNAILIKGELVVIAGERNIA